MESQTAQADGHGNVIVQIIGHNNTVLDPARPWLALRSYTNPFWAAVATGEAGSPGYTAAGQRETALLSPFTRSFELQARAALLKDLTAWLEGGGIGVQVITGPGGRGKTRLAVELCWLAREKGWSAGFAVGEEMARFRAQHAVSEWGWATPLLVVVDYAAAKAPQIGAWLSDLLHHAAVSDPAHPPLRLLLLERQGDPSTPWWRQMLARAPQAERLFAPTAPLAVPPIAEPALRWAIFAEAYARASGGAAPGREEGLDTELARVSAGGEPLFLAMFGLIAARIGLDAAAGLASDEVALRMADEELGRIRRAWAARGGGNWGDVDLPALLAALATLAEGWTAAEAHAAIAREAAALHLGAPASEPLRAALHAALPGEAGGVAPVVPDILGGAVMIRAFESLPDRGRGVIGRAHAAAPETVARTVIRACQDFVIRGRKEPLDWLREVRAAVTDLAGLMALANAMPQATVELREAALEVNSVIAEIARLRRDGGDAEAEPDLAIALNNLSVRLSDLGRREAALGAIEAAVAILRRLAAARPDAFLPELASSLNNLSIRLSDLGRREAALGAIEEAVAIRRNLAAARPDAFLPDLAQSLNNLSNRLSELGRWEAALGAIEAAVAIRRTLAAARPEAFLPDLAQSLNSLSIGLYGLGRLEAALEAIEEAVAIDQRLAAGRPDAFLPGLAQSLNNLSVHLSDLGRREAALGAIEEAVAIRRRLAAARPDAFLPDLAQSLGARGRTMRGADDAAAVASFAEGIGVLRAPFLQLPAAFAGLMRALCGEYVSACEAAGQEPETGLLAPILLALESIGQAESPSPQEK